MILTRVPAQFRVHEYTEQNHKLPGQLKTDKIKCLFVGVERVDKNLDGPVPHEFRTVQSLDRRIIRGPSKTVWY